MLGVHAVLTPDGLAARMHSILIRNPKQTVVVQPHGDVPVQTLVHVFDRLTTNKRLHRKALKRCRMSSLASLNQKRPCKNLNAQLVMRMIIR